jgi:hypothetical protein
LTPAADLFNDFAFILGDSNLRLPFVLVNAQVVDQWLRSWCSLESKYLKRNDIAAGSQPPPTVVGRVAIPILLFLRIRGPSSANML